MPVQLTTSEKSFLEVGYNHWEPWPSAGLAALAADAMWRSGWIREPRSGDSAAHLSLSLTHYQSGSGLLWLVSAFLIPASQDHRFEIELTGTMSPEVSAKCTRSAETRTWYQLFLVLVYPFRSPAYGHIKLSQALALQCLAELLENDGAVEQR